MGKPVDDGLTAEYLRAHMTYEPDTGVFRWRVSRPGTAKDSRAGFSVNKAKYRAIHIAGRRRMEHRLAWLYVHGTWPKADIDHINGDGQDNRIANLRDVPRKTNSENQRAGRAGLMGTTRDAKTGRWKAYICHNYKSIYLGAFDTEEAAHAAYLDAKREMHMGCTI